MHQESSYATFAWKAAIGVTLATTAIILLSVLWFAGDVLLVLFTGVLFAIFLSGLASWVSGLTHLPSGVALTLVVVLLAAVSIGSVLLLAGNVVQQVQQLTDRIPKSEEAIKKRLNQYEWGKRVLSHAPSSKQLLSNVGNTNWFGRITGVFSGTLGVLANSFIVLFVGLYLAASPESYRRPFVRLFPESKQKKTAEVLDALGEKLWYWLLGRISAMAVVLVLTAGGLWLLGVPGALTLGLLAGLLNFIPNIGPLIAVIPAALIALTIGPMQVLYVGLLYLGIQIVESYVLTPLVQKRSVELAPAFTISMQVLLGVLLGLPGLALATPLTAMGVVLVQEIYWQETE